MKNLLFALIMLVLAVPVFAEQGTVTLGTATTSNGPAIHPTPYGTWQKNHRIQYLVLADELINLGLLPGSITSLAFEVANVNNCSPMPNFTIKLKHTAVDELTFSFDNSGYTTVWTHPNFLPVTGWNTHAFNDPFIWNGTSNLLIDICFDIIPGSSTQNASVFYTATPGFNSSIYFRSNNEIACGTSFQGILSFNRANMQISGDVTFCLPPTELTAANITSTTAELGWTPIGNETLWNIKYGAPGFNPSNQGTLISGITTIPYTLASLDSNTDYEFYVQADCGIKELSVWRGPMPFTTTCSPYHLPVFENFDALTVPNLPICWGSIASHPTANPYVRTIVTSDPYSFPNHLVMFNSSTYSEDAAILFISPELFDDMNTLRVNFYAKSGMAAESLLVGLMSDQSDVSSFVEIAQIPLIPAYTFYSVSFEDYTGSHQFIAFRHANTISSRYLYIDDIRIEAIPSCPYPINLIVNNITTTTADLGWTSGGDEVLWNVKYGNPGFNPETEGIFVPDINAVPYTLTNLTILTDYEFYVQAICAPDELSPWEGPKAFQTTSDALIGNYTINSALPTENTNFNNFTDFAIAVNNSGCNGTVVVEVVPDSGPYTEQIILGELPYSSAENNLVINGNGEVLQYLSNTNDQRATLKMNGTDYVTIDNLIIKAMGSGSGQYGYAVQLMNGADHNTFTNCQFHAETVSSLVYFGNNYAAFVTSNNPINALSAGLAASHLTVENCLIQGGDPAIVVNGPTIAQGPPFAENNVIRNNQIKDFFRYGLYLRGQNNSIFENNEISRPERQSVSLAYMIYFTQDMTGSSIQKNRIFDIAGNTVSTNSTYAIYGTGVTAQTGQELLIANNLVYGFNNVNAVQRGFQLANVSNTKIYHNTVHLDNFNHSGSHAIRGLHHSGTNARIDIRNNIFSINSTTTGEMHGLYFATNTADVTSDNNVIHLGSTTGSSHTGFWNGTSYTTLAQWQTANNGIFDLNSVDDDPIFTDPLAGDLMPLSVDINNIGTNLLTDVPDDFFNVARTETPDPGAIEFVPPVLGSVAGYVTKALQGPIYGARVFSGSYEGFTDINGYYEIPDLFPGFYDFTCEAEGYITQTVEGFEVVSNIINELNYELGYAQINVSPDSLTVSLQPGETIMQSFIISNPDGTDPLVWQATAGSSGNGSKNNLLFQPDVHSYNRGSSIYDERCPESTHSNIKTSRDMFDLIGSFPVADTSGSYSVSTDGVNIYVGLWNTNKYDKYGLDGIFKESFTIAGAGNARDLAYDGQFFYGSPNSTTIYQMDFNTQTLIGTITAPAAVRGIAYDSDNDGFWVTTGWNPPIRLINRSGTVLQTLDTEIEAIGGLAWENVTGGSPHLWVYSQTQGTSLNLLAQIDIASGTTLKAFDVANTGVISPGRISGGLFITDKIVPGLWTFLGLAQNDVVWILELATSWLSLNPNAGVVLPGESVNVDVIFNSTGLDIKTYHSSININHNGQPAGTYALPATMHISEILIIPGDANCDGLVNLLDVITIANYIMGLNPEPFCFENADINGDGMINLIDLIGIVNIILD